MKTHDNWCARAMSWQKELYEQLGRDIADQDRQLEHAQKSGVDIDFDNEQKAASNEKEKKAESF